MKPLLAAIAGTALAVFALSVGADTNRYTHCDPTGFNCVADCDPSTGFVASAEDDPCWLIQSPYSDFTTPTISLNVKDYR